MSRRSAALRVVDHYREGPGDLERYTGPREVTNCRHCAFRRAPFATPGDWCADPRIDGSGLVRLDYPYGNSGVEERLFMVRKGECPAYRPSILTRTARLFGLRKPVMR